ncbi:MAG: phosphatidate cytidylyltransferase [Treponema sp.]|nr:phosphatidate cytidylyltransferase [Treponema sp.]
MIDGKVKKIIERLLIFLLGVPAVAALVLFLPYKNNLVLNFVIVFFSGIGAIEFSSMLVKKQINISKAESFILGALAPLAVTLKVSFGLSELIIPVILMAAAGWALMSRIFTKSDIENITNKIIGSFSLIIYPGLFMCWVIFMCEWQNPGAVLLFLFITFGSDSVAWLFGTLLGKNNRGIIAVSPNKSIAGFIGGLIGSVLVAIGALLLFPQIFPIHCIECFYLPNYLILVSIVGLCTGIAAALGDLAESAIKRSCDFIDSGNSVLGRGGVLDSIDSIAVAAPVFYMLFFLFFTL